MVQISFRDPNGRLHRWQQASLSLAKDGRVIVTRLGHGSTTRKPGQYFVPVESIIRVDA